VMKKLMRGERVIIKKRGRGPKPPGGCTVIYCSLALAFKNMMTLMEMFFEGKIETPLIFSFSSFSFFDCGVSYTWPKSFTSVLSR